MANIVEYETRVLDKGEVKLLNQMEQGGDHAVVAAARVSNGIRYNEASKGEDADFKLINYLMKHRHGTPFEHNLFTFYIKCPLFVAREWQRHRIGSYNEVSGRYTEFKAEFYIPSAFRGPGKTNKQGSEFLNDPNADEWLADKFSNWSREAYERYEFLLEQGLAKEMARMVLPLNLYTEFYWSINARALMNFLSLRTGSDAQWEIQQYAKAIEPMFFDVMPFTYHAWVDNGRIAP
jgi:thymidylate synthase (FAD)